MGAAKRDQAAIKKEILGRVQDLCRNRYVKVRDFPPSLRRKCAKVFGSVRSAKWKAGVINHKAWNYADFLKHVCSHCTNRYCEDKEWPANLKYWAKYFCGSIRRARSAATALSSPEARFPGKSSRGLSEQEILRWIQAHPNEKVHFWPAHIIIHAEQYFNSVRRARLLAGTLKDQRARQRKVESVTKRN